MDITNGVIHVDGPLTRWRQETPTGFVSFAFGEGTVAELKVSDGGRASFPKLIVGEAGGNSTIRISGIGFHEALGQTPSTVYVGNDPFMMIGPGDLHIGAQFEDQLRESNGSIEISDGGQLSVKRHTYMSSYSSTAAVLVDGVGSVWTNEGDIFVGYSGNANHGFGNGSLFISNGGFVTSDNGIVGVPNGFCGMEVCPPSNVTVDGPGSTWRVFEDLIVGSGILTVSSGGRTEATTVSTTNVAELRGNGVIESFLVTSGGRVSPGIPVGALTIDGSFKNDDSAELFIELASATRFDQLIVQNDIMLVGGVLSVELIDGFMPQGGESFDILEFDELNGTFTQIDLPQLSAFLNWDTTQLYSDGILMVVSTALADYNGDGAVDAADYVIWRKNDGTQPGYDLWRANFGQTNQVGAASGAAPDSARNGGQATSVPEPNSVLQLLFGVVIVASAGRWAAR
jgi:T5SS/PEP-CTERM-associated repeat protein